MCAEKSKLMCVTKRNPKSWGFNVPSLEQRHNVRLSLQADVDADSSGELAFPKYLLLYIRYLKGKQTDAIANYTCNHKCRKYCNRDNMQEVKV